MNIKKQRGKISELKLQSFINNRLFTLLPLSPSSYFATRTAAIWMDFSSLSLI